MKVPTRIPLMGRDVDVEYVSDLKDGIQRCYGLWHSEGRIQVDDIQSIENMKRTLIHELVHGVLCWGGVTHLLTEEQEEAVCTACEALADVIYLDPDVVSTMDYEEV